MTKTFQRDMSKTKRKKSEVKEVLETMSTCSGTYDYEINGQGF